MSISESAASAPTYGSHRSGPPTADWPEIDGGLLQERVSAVPRFPLDVLPNGWSDWVGDTARAVGAPADYVAQAVLAAAAGLAGTTVRIRISPVWEEPLLLWLALIGPASSGKSPALASVRNLLGALDAPDRSNGAAPAADDDSRPHVISTSCTLPAIAAAAGESARGVMLWRDEPSNGFALLGLGRGCGELAALPVNVLCSLEPDRLAQTLHHGGEGMAARFLYAWPHPPAYCPLADRTPAADEEASSMLRRIRHLPGTAKYPFLLTFDEPGVKAFDSFLASLHAGLRDTEGLDAAWLGKGAGQVARLAGVLELLEWSATDSPNGGSIGAEQVERATSLWLEYFLPHARAFFDRAAPTDTERRARRVVRWLRAQGLQDVSREAIRREALGRTVDAAGANIVLDRLATAGIVRRLPYEMPPQGGRPASRWQVNPALATL